MKKHILTTALLLSAMLASQMSLTAAAADTGADDIILISPNPNAAQTETVPDTAGDTAAKNILQTQYEQLAGMYAYDGVASQLYSIGVLLGDGVNFNLLDLPDRQQACVMVVRMRGEEEAAKAAYAAGEVTCPFEDVEDYAKPYIAWLYDKGITKGVGGGKFGNAMSVFVFNLNSGEVSNKCLLQCVTERHGRTLIRRIIILIVAHANIKLCFFSVIIERKSSIFSSSKLRYFSLFSAR